jgi:hypothetical protein
MSGVIKCNLARLMLHFHLKNVETYILWSKLCSVHVIFLVVSKRPTPSILEIMYTQMNYKSTNSSCPNVNIKKNGGSIWSLLVAPIIVWCPFLQTDRSTAHKFPSDAPNVQTSTTAWRRRRPSLTWLGNFFFSDSNCQLKALIRFTAELSEARRRCGLLCSVMPSTAGLLITGGHARALGRPKKQNPYSVRFFNSCH